MSSGRAFGAEAPALAAMPPEQTPSIPLPPPPPSKKNSQSLTTAVAQKKEDTKHICHNGKSTLWPTAVDPYAQKKKNDVISRPLSFLFGGGGLANKDSAKGNKEGAYDVPNECRNRY